MVDIRDQREAVEAINAILNNHGIAEVKIEGNGTKPTVVEIRRTLKTSPTKDKTK